MCIVLVVDADPTARDTTIALLEAVGVSAFQAARGDEALLVLRAHPEITLVLLDAELGGAKDAQLVRKIRRARSDLPILMIAEAGRSIPAMAEVKVLTRPFTATELYAQAAETLSGDNCLCHEMISSASVHHY